MCVCGAVVCVIVFFFLVLPNPAQAYLDLGSGSLFIQVFFASLLAAFFTFKSFLGKVKKTLGKKSKPNKSP